MALVPFTHVLVNTNLRPHLPAEWGVTRPADGAAALAELGVEIIEADVVDETRPTRHEPAKLAAALVGALAALRPAPKPAPLAAIKALAASIF